MTAYPVLFLVTLAMTALVVSAVTPSGEASDDGPFFVAGVVAVPIAIALTHVAWAGIATAVADPSRRATAGIASGGLLVVVSAAAFAPYPRVGLARLTAVVAVVVIGSIAIAWWLVGLAPWRPIDADRDPGETSSGYRPPPWSDRPDEH